MMLLWLSVLCLVPFDICSIDSALSSAVSGISGDKSLLVKDVMHLCQLYLGDTGPPRDAASLCLSSLLTRPDMEEGCLRDFLGWAVGVIAHWSALDVQEQRDLSSQSFQFIGVLYCLAQIFKRGHRSKLLTYAAAVLLPCLATVGADHQTLSRKLLSKLFQRIAMTFLPPRIAEWRYTRGKRSLKQNLSGSDSSKEPIQTVDCPAESTEESAVPQEMESILQTVLNFLSDKDTVVRWSAAKGVGRITMLLPKDYADDIVGAVCGLFEDGEDDCSWHGGCLALAELARRGLLLPERLSEVVPFVERAILFDLVRGQHSVGAHVRDAACYVCWSFSRAYSPAIMQSHSAQLSASMLITALFDREVNCRRAASAAFQENVGRQGNENFPFGIEIITVADYFSVGNRGSAYLKVAPKVAAMSAEISGRLFAHLCEVKVGHWDEDVRVLAAKAVARLGPSDLPLTVQHLRVLANNCTSSLFNVRHGSILATAELLLAVAESGQSLPGDLLELVVGVVPMLEKERLYRGRGGELVRTATCLLLRNIARAAVPVTLKLQIAFVDALNEHLKQPFEALQKAASDALRQVLFAYFSRSANDPSESLRDKTVLRYVSALQSDDNVAVTRGSALALGALPLRVAVQPEGTFDLVVDCLDASSSTSKRIMGEYDAATCKNSVEALVELAERVCESDHFSASRLERVFQVLARACADYSIDKRGDTGSWTRLAALRGFERVLYAAVRRQRLFVGLERVASGELAVGDRFLSSFGVATVNSLATNANGTITAIVAFPSQSLGNLVEADFQEAVEGGALRIVMGGTILKHSPPARDAPVEAWLTPDQVSRALSCLLKQLAEKLDSVREVAGNIFLRLSLSDVPLCAEDRSVFLAALKAVRRDDSCGTQVQEQFAHINWTQPDHVYAVLAEVLACPHHFHAVFSGLVISIGGITATISRAATSCLVQFLGRQQGSDNATVLQLLSSVLRLFAELHKDDRVICPLLKCVVVLLRDRILDLSAPARQSFANALVKAVLAEMRDCASVTKLSLCADVLVLLVAFDTGLARFLSLKALVRFLGHKYPKIRKCECSFSHGPL